MSDNGALLIDHFGLESETILKPLAPLTRRQATAVGYYDGFCARYGLMPFLRCLTCFEKSRPDGCETRLSAHHARIKCRCGIREYSHPVGEVTLVQRLGNTAHVLGDRQPCELTAENGEKLQTTAHILDDQEAAILKLYFRTMADLNYSPKLVHQGCFDGRVDDESVMRVMVTDSQIVLICKCDRTLFHQARVH